MMFDEFILMIRGRQNDVARFVPGAGCSANRRAPSLTAAITILLVATAPSCPPPAAAQFTDVTPPVLADPAASRGVAWVDYDADGDLDLYVTNTGAANRLFRNDLAAGSVAAAHRDVPFSDQTSGPLGDTGAGQSGVWGDFDSDGDLDLYLTQWGANRLLRNDADAGFVDVTAAPLDDDGFSNAAAWLDFDLDGDLDLYLVNQADRNRLFRNDGVVGFADVAAPPIDHDGLNRGVAVGDFDGDGDADIYLVNASRNILGRNRGDGTFVRTVAETIEDGGPGRGAAWGDFDGDSDLDLYLVNDGAANKLFRNEGVGGFVDVTTGALGDAGLGVDVAWVDVDLDTTLDLYFTNAPGSNRLLRGDGSGGFQDATAPPLDDPGQSYGVAWADHDLDGDLDLYAGHLNAPNRLLRNDQSTGHHWLQIDLAGIDSNRFGIGARLRALGGGADQLREISTGAGYLSQQSLRVEYGLGDDTELAALIVDWPSGRRQVFESVAVDRLLRIVEPGSWMSVTPPLLEGVGAGWGATWTDPDLDGDLDLYLSVSDGPNQFFENTGDPLSFDYIDATAAPLDDAGPGRGVAWGDADNDGDLDLFLANHAAPNRLLRHDGESGFIDIAGGALADPGATTAGAWVDFDLDGDLDIYLVTDGAANRMMRNDGDLAGALTFSDAGNSPPAAVLADPGPGRAAAWGDADEDGDPDLYLVQNGVPNRLLRNDSAGFFVDITTPPLDDAGDGSAATWGDIDGDLDLDLVVANVSQEVRLYRNTASGFVEITESALAGAGPARDLLWSDMDLDADLDLYVVNDTELNAFFRNDGGSRFVALHNAILDDLGAGRSVAAGDVDLDGDLDLYLVNADGPNRLFRNEVSATLPAPSRWLQIDLTGSASNRFGVGSRVRIRADGREQIRCVGVGRGSAGQSALTAAFGLRESDEVDAVDIHWTSRRSSRLGAIPPDQRLTAVESPSDWTDVAVGAVADTGAGFGAAWADFDADGDLDLYVSHDGQPNRLLLQEVDGVFADVASGPSADAGAGRGVAAGDYDRDGDVDIYLANGGANRLLRNDGAAGFVDATESPLVCDGESSAVTWIDVERDGDLDLYVCRRDGANRLLRNDAPEDGAVTFTDITVPPLGDTDGTTSAIWSDIELDGDLDLFLASSPGANKLLRNDSERDAAVRFSDITPAALTGEGLSQDGAWGDLDSDGDFDLYVVQRGTPNQLFRNDGFDGFNEQTHEILADPRDGVGASLADVDLDGDLDIYLSGWFSGNRLFRNDGDLAFADDTTGPLLAGGATTGATWGDFDRDGDPDLFQIYYRESDRLFRNDQTTGWGWVQVELIGALSSPGGEGAQVRVVAQRDGQLRETGAGAGALSQNSPITSFGLGFANVVDSLQVRWPSGVFQQRIGVPLGSHVRLAEIDAMSDVVPPSTDVARAREEFTLVLAARLDGIRRSVLFVRRAGYDSTFQPFPMSLENPIMSADLPFSLLSESGLEYYVEVVYGPVTVVQPATAPAATYFLPVESSELTLQPQPAAGRYVMMGLPFVPHDGDPAAVLEPLLGGYDQTRWRLGRYDPATESYREYPATEAFAPGRGFWLIQRQPVDIVLEGTSASTVTGVEIELAPGWNQIAHPYVFPVAWADVDLTSAPDIENRLIGYADGEYVDSGILEPWAGYWLRNNGDAAQSVIVPGRRTSGAAPAAVQTSLSFDWSIGVTADGGQTRDGPDRAAIAARAVIGIDALDLHEPPSLPDHVAVWFERETPGGGRRLARDVQPRPAGRAGDGGAGDVHHGTTWNLIAASPGGRPIAIETPPVATRLIFDGIESVPAELEVRLVDPDGYEAIDLRRTDAPRLWIAPGNARRFVLAVGSLAYVEEIEERRATVSPVVRVGPAYPNPFNPYTTIRFALPRRAAVSLKIYDIRGRHVRTLLDGPHSAGRFAASWNGEDAHGRPLPSGIYFYRFRADDHTTARSMLLLR